MTRFCKKNNVPLITFGQDNAQSAGYMVLSAGRSSNSIFSIDQIGTNFNFFQGDEVYCEQNTILGSIGAIYRNMKINSFMNNYGIGYTTYTSNE